MSKPKYIADTISVFETLGDPVQVSLSNELVHLLSDQLYQSPMKAVEELVVNSYDADASECRIYIPAPANQEDNYIVIFDNGIGMDKAGLADLWQIGRSNKREDEIQKRRKRKQIGKFGIGKLATYTIANKLTYITKTGSQILSITIDFSDFIASPTGPNIPISAPVHIVNDWTEFKSLLTSYEVAQRVGLDIDKLHNNGSGSWTIAILEELKEKAQQLTQGRLQWILSTSMPLKSDFRLFLNGDEIASAKEEYTRIAEFELIDLPEYRIESLKKSTGENWRISDGRLIADAFPSGITGSIIVTERSLPGKSDDLMRSNGFFIRVRERLVNETDPLFGLKALHHGTFNRFWAEIRADDLDRVLKASRETIEESRLKEKFRALLREIFNEANKRREDYERSLAEKEKSRKEGERGVVPPTLVEYPVADALIVQMSDPHGTEADESWFYLTVEPDTDLQALIQELYNSPRSKYRYQYTHAGMANRLVQFIPSASTFRINEDHDLVREYSGEGRTRIFLEDFVTAEAMLEIYLRESQFAPHVVGAILERRDKLLRSLVKDHSYSLEAISYSLSDAGSDQYDLEISLVVAARALGFVAKHISGSGEPDGIARFVDYPDGEKKITLEAKSSGGTPSLSAIDFAGIQEHVQRHNADGCLLVSPSYPGSSRENDSAVSRRANELKISCWTVEQLSKIIMVAEARQITARNILDIVLNKYCPEDVTIAVEKLLAEPQWETRSLYEAILTALKELDGRLLDSPRTVDMVAIKVSDRQEFRSIGKEVVEVAIKELASGSQGGMNLRGQSIVVHVSHEELLRRVDGLIQTMSAPRKLSNFREL